MGLFEEQSMTTFSSFSCDAHLNSSGSTARDGERVREGGGGGGGGGGCRAE